MFSRIARALIEYLTANEDELLKESPSDGITDFCMLRETFFQGRKLERRVFEEALISPPKHLAQKIYEIRKPLRELNARFIRTALSGIKLKDGISKDMAERYLDNILVSFRTMLSVYSPSEDLHSMLSGVGDLLAMMLFGIAEK